MSNSIVPVVSRSEAVPRTFGVYAEYPAPLTLGAVTADIDENAAAYCASRTHYTACHLQDGRNTLLATGRKYDYPPLLGPGSHRMTLIDIWNRITCFGREEPSPQRTKVYYALEQLVQDILACGLRCDVYANGSFATEKPEPGDVDAAVVIDADVHSNLNPEQENLVVSIQDGHNIACLDTDAYVRYPRGHKLFDNEYLNGGRHIGRIYGIENSEAWLKGYVVIPIGENDVGLRIRRW